MRLVKLQVENFRCYRDPFSVNFDDMTAIVGRNDVGKSTLMDALAIFFEESKIDKDDGAVTGNKKAIKITCVFDDIPSSIIIDEDFETSLAQEHLLNADGCLEITKTYDGSLATPKILSIDAHCLHPTADGVADLLHLKRTDLLSRARELGVDVTAVNKKANAPLRNALWSACGDLKISSRSLSLEKETGKQIWTALSPYLPSFALFKSDRASTDQDAEAQDPLKAAIRDAIKSVESKLLEVQAFVEEEVKKIADATVEKIREMDASLAETLNPVVTTRKWDTLFQTSITGDNGIPINKRGSGVKRLILLNFFRAKAERAAEEKHANSIIYAVEEPETSQHPRNQRMLVSALREVSTAPNRQVIVTTHTPMLARVLPDSSLRFIDRAADGSRELACGGTATNTRIAASLGVLPDHAVKIFVGIEGKHDIAFLKGMGRMFLASGKDVPDLEALEIDGELIFFPFGGSNLALWSSRLSPLNRPEYHICDRDNAPPANPKYHAHVATVNGRAGCKAVVTDKMEMENYLHPAAVVEAYQANGISITLSPSFSDFDDVPELVAEAVHNAGGGKPWSAVDAETRAKKSSTAKAQLNAGAVAKMTMERLAITDPTNEILAWFQDIKSIMESVR